MKFTNYFLHTRQRPDRKDIKMEWIEQVYRFPEHQDIQADGRKRMLGYIKEVTKYLRIVVLEDNQTIHNAFFDRDLKKTDMNPSSLAIDSSAVQRQKDMYKLYGSELTKDEGSPSTFDIIISVRQQVASS